AAFQHLDFAPSQRIGFALGATYRIRLGNDPARTDAIEIMAGYGHTFFADQSRTDPNASGLPALSGTPCPQDQAVTGPNQCSDGSKRYGPGRLLNLATLSNAMNVVNVGLAYRF